jgi:hypothetical protein
MAAVSAQNAGVAVDPVQLANNRLAAAVESVNVCAGVVVAVLTDVVNNGGRFPELNAVTVPAPPVDPELQLHAPLRYIAMIWDAPAVHGDDGTVQLVQRTIMPGGGPTIASIWVIVNGPTYKPDMNPLGRVNKLGDWRAA